MWQKRVHPHTHNSSSLTSGDLHECSCGASYGPRQNVSLSRYRGCLLCPGWSTEDSCASSVQGWAACPCPPLLGKHGPVLSRGTNSSSLAHTWQRQGQLLPCHAGGEGTYECQGREREFGVWRWPREGRGVWRRSWAVGNQKDSFVLLAPINLLEYPPERVYRVQSVLRIRDSSKVSFIMYSLERKLVKTEELLYLENRSVWATEWRYKGNTCGTPGLPV